jgi:hypothetical protein
VDQVELSADDLARLAEVDPAFIQRAVQARALQKRETAGGFGVQDAARLRFLKAWEAAGRRPHRPAKLDGDLKVLGHLKA